MMFGEAAGVILGVMDLLRDPLVQLPLAQLDACCGGMLTAWKPPWIEHGIARMDMTALQGIPQAAVLAWAMNLDGFVNFLKNAAIAIKAGRVVLPAAVGGAVAKAEEEQEEKPGEADEAAVDAPVAAASAAGAGAAEEGSCSSVPGGNGGDGGFPAPSADAVAGDGAAEEVGCASALSSDGGDGGAPPQLADATLVAVLPDSATTWQVEVLGSLGIATGVYLVYEGAWRRDFGASPAVPFSVQPLAAASAAAAPAAASSAPAPPANGCDEGGTSSPSSAAASSAEPAFTTASASSAAAAAAAAKDAASAEVAAARQPGALRFAPTARLTEADLAQDPQSEQAMVVLGDLKGEGSEENVAVGGAAASAPGSGRPVASPEASPPASSASSSAAPPAGGAAAPRRPGAGGGAGGERRQPKGWGRLGLAEEAQALAKLAADELIAGFAGSGEDAGDEEL